MMRHMMTYIAKLGLVLTLFVALTGAGVAHRTQMPVMDDGLAAYLAAGGSLADLCGDGDVEGGSHGCAACHLVAGAVLPAVASSFCLLPAHQYTPLPDAQLHFHAHLAADPSRPVRAPPVV